MGETVSWSLTVQVSDGPALTSSRSINVDAYDMIKVIVPDTADKTAGGSATRSAQRGVYLER